MFVLVNQFRGHNMSTTATPATPKPGKETKEDKAILRTQGMFHTPKDSEELMDWCERHPAHDGTRISVITAAMMGWNLAIRCLHEGYTLAPDDTMGVKVVDMTGKEKKG